MVADIPEGNAVDNVAVLAEYPENPVVLVFLQHLLPVGDLVRAAVEAELAAHVLVDAHVELGHMDMVDNLLVEVDSVVDVLGAGSVYIIVSLHSDTVDRNSGILHLLDHVVDPLALGRIGVVVVVVEEEGVGVGLVSILERLGDELVTCYLVQGGVAVGRRAREPLLVSHGLVDHVPAVDYVLVAGDDSVDVALHVGEEFLL